MNQLSYLSATGFCMHGYKFGHIFKSLLEQFLEVGVLYLPS